MAEVELAEPLPPDLQAKGPAQEGRGVHGQYVYWICMAMPRQETILARGIKRPTDFDRDSFRELIVQTYTEEGLVVIETACFLEPHADGEPHLNLLVRASAQHRWKKIWTRLLQQHKVYVGFGENVKTWAEGVAYGRVASDHKGEEALDKDPKQWHKDGTPTPFEQVLPRRWQQQGFVRHTRMTSLAFYELCRQHHLDNTTDLWAKATELSEAGDKALLAYLLDSDAEAQLAKVLRGVAAQENARRAKLSREAVLEERFAKNDCCCSSPDRCYGLMKGILQANGLDGVLQAEVLGALRTGRAKRRTLCLLGEPDCGKSFLFTGLKEVYRTYVRPDGGSYQLEELLEKELVYLNDFEYDVGAKEWMPWSYFKNFLEGEVVSVARPKNRGGNTTFKGTAPVFMTACKEVTLCRRGQEVQEETRQMRKRIKYFHLPHSIPEGQVVEVLRHCGYCTAKLYLEGKQVLDTEQPAPPPPPQPQAAASRQPGEPALKKPRTATECLNELKDLKGLLDAGLLTPDEFGDLKARLLRGD